MHQTRQNGSAGLAAILTGYAVEARYPGTSEEVTEDDSAAALELAERVVHWAESQVRSATAP